MDYKNRCQEIYYLAMSQVEARGPLADCLTIHGFFDEIQKEMDKFFLELSGVPEYYTQFKRNKPKMLAIYGRSVTSKDLLDSLKKSLVEGKADSFVSFTEKLFVVPA